MRRVILLLVVALVGAGWYGLAGSTTALAVNSTSVSQAAFRGELTAISTHPTLDCYLSSLAGDILTGAGRDTVTAAGTAAWANLRVEGIAINDYVVRTFDYYPTAAQLATAQTDLEGELTAAASQAGNSCTGTSAQALAEMPAEMRTAQVLDQASSAYLVSKLNSTIPLTTASIKQYYEAHVAHYNTICLSVAVVPLTSATAFAASQSAGMSMAKLAKTYSLDSSASKGGAVGCFSPTSSSYASVRSDVGTTPIGHFPTKYVDYTPTQGGATYALYLGATSETTTPFAQAEPSVISDIQTLNSTSANNVKANILYDAAVSVDPAIGRWSLESSGPTILAPGLPSETGPATKAQLTTTSSLPYQ